MTGPKFAFSIREKGTALLRLLAKKATRINELIEEQDAAETLLGQMSTTDPRRAGLIKDVKDILAQITTITDQQSDISKTVIRANELGRSFASMEPKEFGVESLGQIMIAHPDAPTTEWAEVSEIQQAHRIVKGAKFFRSHHDPDAETYRQQWADKLCFLSGMTPVSMSNMSAAEKERATEFLVEEVLNHTTTEQLIAAQNGAIPLDELLDRPARDELFGRKLGLQPFALPALQHSVNLIQ
ncbi:hypothetical protein QD357_14365 [Rhizobium sp. BR 317]|uniref:hypothetical protein n=1 Tax=Rhizobium sp. BR 317 TaxID=3040015 RepID=UPI0039BF83D8